MAFGQAGNVALIFALVLPVFLVTGLGAVQLNQVMTDKKRTQDVADSAALMGATQLSLAPAGAAQRAQAYAQAQLGDVARYAAVQVQASVAQNTLVTVAIDTQRSSFFGNLLPLGGFQTHVTSSAKAVNSTPLCVLAFGSTPDIKIEVQTLDILQAPSCLVHSEQSLAVDTGAVLYATTAEAVTTASGIILPGGGQSSAPPFASPQDPFASLNVDPPNACPAIPGAPTFVGPGQTVTLDSYETNPAKAFHGDISVAPAGTLILSPGEHYFCGQLAMGGLSTLGGRIQGSDVALIFAKGSGLNLNAYGVVTLSGRQSGALSGFVLIADRSYTSDFHVQSGAIQTLTGTVYVPSAKLVVDGTVGLSMLALSPWTVIAAKSFQLDGGGTLVVNANYSVSPVPVPKGVGNQRQNVELTP